MKISFYLIFIELLLINYHVYSQSIITFDEQGWTSDQSIDTSFTIDNYTFSSNKNIYTNYGYNFDVNNVSIYYAFQNPETDQIDIKTLNNQLVNFTSVASYQVSEIGTDTLIIEGWDGSNKKYTTRFSNINSWSLLTLHYNGVNRVIIRSGNLSGESLFDYNFDNFSFNNTTDTVLINNVPQSYNLNQNYPNPFNPSTKISYNIPSNVNSQTLNVVLKVYDILGNEVATLVDEEKEAGSYSVTFSASNLASGIYIYKLSATGGTEAFISTKKMMLLK